MKELASLDKSLTLEHKVKKKIADTETELNSKSNELAKVQAEIDGLHKYIKQLMAEKTKLETQIANYRKQSADDISILSTASKKAIEGIDSKLSSGIEDGMSEINKLNDMSLRVGKDLGKLEADIESLNWIKPLLTLVRGEDGLDRYQVRVIGTNVLRSMSSWLQENYANDQYLLRSQINSVIRELEQWK